MKVESSEPVQGHKARKWDLLSSVSHFSVLALAPDIIPLHTCKLKA